MWLLKLRRLARKAGREALILFFAVRHPDTPLPLKAAATAALVYVLSPVDLLPDIPLIGMVDDLLVLSLGLPMLVRRLPPAVLADSGVRADRVMAAMGFRKSGAETGAAGAGDVEVEVGAAPRPRRSSGSAGRRTGRAGKVSEAKILSEASAPRARRKATPGKA